MYQIKNLHQTKYQSMTTEQTTATFRRMKRRAATKAKAQEPQPQPQPTPTGQPNIRELLPEDGSFHFFLNRIGGRGR
jgi:hypothetical protein